MGTSTDAHADPGLTGVHCGDRHYDDDFTRLWLLSHRIRQGEATGSPAGRCPGDLEFLAAMLFLGGGGWYFSGRTSEQATIADITNAAETPKNKETGPTNTGDAA